MEIEHKDSSRVEARCAEHPEQVAVGTCGRCGNYFCEACQGRREEGRDHCNACRAARAYVAWEDASLGVWDRYYRTVRGSLVQLPRFAAELPAQGSAVQAMWFGLLPTSVAALIGSALMATMLGWIATNMPDPAANGTPGMLFTAGLTFVVYLLMSLGVYLAYVLFWPVLLVGVARLLGRRELSYRGTLRCLCYASGLNCLLWVPLVGLLAAIYHFVVASFCLGAMSRSSVLIGFAIFGLPSLLCGLGSCGAYVALMMATLGR